jgi:hypothetical protein
MALLLDIDPHGRVVPQSDPVRRALADRAGRFLLLPAAPDLLVALRTPTAGGSVPRPRCLLAGDLSGFPIADFVAFVHQSRLSGVLTVAAGGAERSIAFQDGEVRRAQSSVAGERIGDVAVRLGFATEQRVTAAVQPGKPLGKALVDAGILTANDLWKCFHEQVTSVFHAILLTRDGTFRLLDEDATERPGTPLAVNTQQLLMDGIRRIDEMSLFSARIPGPRTYLRPGQPKRRLTLMPQEHALLALVDGQRTLGEIATLAHVSEFEATKIFFHLAEGGYVEAVAHPAVGGDPASQLRALAAGLNDLLRVVGGAVPEGARPAFRSGVRAFLVDAAQPLARVWARVSVREDGTLDEDTLLGNVAALKGAAFTRLEPSGRPGRLLGQAARELVFLHLFLAGEGLGRDADQALSAQVRQRLAALDELARVA